MRYALTFMVAIISVSITSASEGVGFVLYDRMNDHFSVQVERIFTGATIPAYTNAPCYEDSKRDKNTSKTLSKEWSKIMRTAVGESIDCNITYPDDFIGGDSSQRVVIIYLGKTRDKTNTLQERLIRSGLAVYWLGNGSVPDKELDARWRAAQEKAQEQKTGIWGKDPIWAADHINAPQPTLGLKKR